MASNFSEAASPAVAEGRSRRMSDRQQLNDDRSRDYRHRAASRGGYAPELGRIASDQSRIDCAATGYAFSGRLFKGQGPRPDLSAGGRRPPAQENPQWGRTDCRGDRNASSTLRAASFLVSPSDMQPGSSGTVARNPRRPCPTGLVPPRRHHKGRFAYRRNTESRAGRRCVSSPPCFRVWRSTSVIRLTTASIWPSRFRSNTPVITADRRFTAIVRRRDIRRTGSCMWRA